MFYLLTQEGTIPCPINSSDLGNDSVTRIDEDGVRPRGVFENVFVNEAPVRLHYFFVVRQF